jgi:NADPH:quinone reductase-like Zn-dependent oxidoreductase
MQTTVGSGRYLPLVGLGSTVTESDSGARYPLFGGKKVMFPIPRQDQDMARYFKNLIESGQFKPFIDRTYPLDQIVEAYKYVETGQKIGNVVISVVPSN